MGYFKLRIILDTGRDFALCGDGCLGIYRWYDSTPYLLQVLLLLLLFHVVCTLYLVGSISLLKQND